MHIHTHVNNFRWKRQSWIHKLLTKLQQMTQSLRNYHMRSGEDDHSIAHTPFFFMDNFQQSVRKLHHKLYWLLNSPQSENSIIKKYWNLPWQKNVIILCSAFHTKNKKKVYHQSFSYFLKIDKVKNFWGSLLQNLGKMMEQEWVISGCPSIISPPKKTFHFFKNHSILKIWTVLRPFSAYFWM